MMASSFPLGIHVSHSAPPPRAHLPVNMANIADAWLASYVAALPPASPALPTPAMHPSSQDTKCKHHHGPKSCFYIFSFSQTQQNNQVTLPKQKKDPFLPCETAGPFPGDLLNQRCSPALQSLPSETYTTSFGFPGWRPSSVRGNRLPSKVPALHSTFLQKTAIQVPETPPAQEVHLHQAPPAAVPQPLSTNHPHIHLLVCSH